MKVTLYHATSPRSADLIEQHGFKDRVAAGVTNWTGDAESKAGFTYLTRAYPIFYAMQVAGEDNLAAVFKVTVDTADLYPDEDYLFSAGVITKPITDLAPYKQYGERSLEQLGNVAVRPEAITIVERKNLSVKDMFMYSDPSIGIINYKILGNYYRILSDAWFNGEDLTLLPPAWETIT